MAGITISGSSMDVQSIVSQLMSIEQIPLSKINSKITQTQSKISALGTLKSKLSALQKAAIEMTTPSKIQGSSVTVSSSNEAAVTAKVSGSPSVTDHSVLVSSFSKAQTLESGYYSSGTSSVGVNSNITLERGTWSGTSFAADTALGSVTISTNSKSLTQISDEINAAGIGVTASVVQDTNGFKLSIVSNDPGTSSEIRMKKNSGLSSAFVYDLGAVNSGMTESVAGADTKYSIDGVSYTASGNKATHDGLDYTFNAIATSPVTVSAKLDTTGLKTTVNAFVKAYNDVQSYISAVAPVGPDTVGTLKGEASIRNLLYGLRKTVTSPVGPAGMRQLTMLGIQYQTDGSLALDEASFDKAVAAGQQNVIDMLAGASGGKGVMDLINDKINEINASDGIIGARLDGLRRLSTSQKAQAVKLEDRLPKIETMLFNKYSRLDAAITSMQTTMNGLTSALDSLSSNSSNN